MNVLSRKTVDSKRILVGIALMAMLAWEGRAVWAGQVQTLYVSSPDMSQILSGNLGGSMNPFVTLPGDTPVGLTVASDGTLYAGFAQSQQIQAYDPAGHLLWSTSTGANTPAGMTLNAAGDLLVVETGPSGSILERFNSSGADLGRVATLGGTSPYSIAVDSSSRIFTTDLIDGLVRRVDSGQAYQFYNETAVAVATGASGGLFLVATGDYNEILSLNVDQNTAHQVADLGMFQPQGLTIDASGNFLVSGFDGNSGNYGIEMLGPDGTLLNTFGSDLLNPTFLALSAPVTSATPEPSMLVTAVVGVVGSLLVVAWRRHSV